jgi:hypothetical protein
MKTSKEKYQIGFKREPSWMQRFFILCSGADREILAEYPTEWNKFAGIGATIFLTACLALLSGSYAIHFVFEDFWLSFFFGIFWAIVIFNLDRYIVLSLRKPKIPTSTDIKRESDPNKKEELQTERRRLLWQQALMASPRFVIALIIAITVSKPIELRLFQSRINKELENIVKAEDSKFDEEEQKRIADLNNQMAGINKQEQDDKSAVFSSNPIYQDAKTSIPKIEADISNREQLINENKKIIAANQYTETRFRIKVDPITLERRSVPYNVVLDNATAKEKKRENEKIQVERDDFMTELTSQKQKQSGVETTLSADAAAISTKYQSAKDNISQQITQLNNTYIQRKNEWIMANKRSADLPARLEALGNISSYGNSIWWASFVITLLFIALETAPVVVKLLTKRGPYDENLDAQEYKVYIEESRKIDSLNREINEYIKLSNEAAKLSGSLRIQAEKEKLDIELQNNKKLLNTLADRQRELAEMYADAWYQEEKEKALQKVKGLYGQAFNPVNHSNSPALAQTPSQPTTNSTLQSTVVSSLPLFDLSKLMDIQWKQKNMVDLIEYCFTADSSGANELRYFENNQMIVGNWTMNNSQNELSIDFLNNKVDYEIIEINDRSMSLRNIVSGEILEFDKV